MFLSHRALDGSRRHRLAVGTLLFLVMLLLAAGMTAEAVGGRFGALARVGFAVGALSLYAVAWWCARYWYAAFSQGRRAEPVPEPNPWPWALPYVFLLVVMTVTGVRQLIGGEDGGWFSLGFAALLGMPFFVVGAMGLWALVRSPRRGRTRGGRTAPAPAPDEPPRPRRDWGPIG
ncbi:hypothetical protein [Streptomyces sp. NPDC055189]